MRQVFGFSASLLCVTSAIQSAKGDVTFGKSVPTGGYTQGTVYVVSGDSYTDTTTAFGAPSPIVGAGSAFAAVLTPFNSHYETTDLLQIGRGGSVTLQLASPVPATGDFQVGIFTSAGFSDQNYPFGQVSNPAHTFAFDEYGAERTAVVEVAQNDGEFHSLGRMTFDAPTNYYQNITDPFQYPAPADPVLADFGKPFTHPTSDFSGETLGQVLVTLDGSAGGTWASVPGDLGISKVNFVRLSDPLWILPDGSFSEMRTSVYGGYVKPADLFIDAVAGVPGNPGDSTGDGTVNSEDFDALASHFGQSADQTFTNGDFNGDGIVNAMDFNDLAEHYGETSGAAALSGALVPEPAAIGSFLFAVALVRRQKR